MPPVADEGEEVREIRYAAKNFRHSPSSARAGIGLAVI